MTDVGYTPTYKGTTSIALLIMGGPWRLKEKGAPVTDERFQAFVQDTLNHYLSGWPDERRADLYSRICERAGPKTPMTELLAVIDEAMAQNERIAWPH